MLTHILRHMFQCEITACRWLLLFGVILGQFCISLHQTRMQYFNEGLQMSPIFANRFLNLEFCRQKSYLSIGKQHAVPVSLEAGGGIPCRPNPAATLLVV